MQREVIVKVMGSGWKGMSEAPSGAWCSWTKVVRMPSEKGNKAQSSGPRVDLVSSRTGSVVQTSQTEFPGRMW